jgi:hypothetical protein
MAKMPLLQEMIWTPVTPSANSVKHIKTTAAKLSFDCTDYG